MVAIGERAQPVLDLVRPEVGDAAELQEREQTNAEPQTEEKKLEAALQTEREMDKELRAQQEQLSLALEAAQQANKSKTVFLNNMSHDIRTLMNAIIGFTSLAESHVDQQEKVKEYLRKIVVSSEHLLSLINDVLDMSRIESGKVKVDEKPLHLPALIDDLRAIIQPSADGKRVDFRIEMDGAANKDVIADKLKLTQILLNILSNGVKYSKDGGALVLRVTQEGQAPAGCATYHFAVKDTGIGMSEEYQKHVFETFSREETAAVSAIQGTARVWTWPSRRRTRSCWEEPFQSHRQGNRNLTMGQRDSPFVPLSGGGLSALASFAPIFGCVRPALRRLPALSKSRCKAILMGACGCGGRRLALGVAARKADSCSFRPEKRTSRQESGIPVAPKGPKRCRNPGFLPISGFRGDLALQESGNLAKTKAAGLPPCRNPEILPKPRTGRGRSRRFAV